MLSLTYLEVEGVSRGADPSDRFRSDDSGRQPWVPLPRKADQRPGEGNPYVTPQFGATRLGGGSPKIQQCNQSTKSGGQGVTETKHILGRTGPTSFTLAYDTRIQPDKIDVYYQGRLIRSTGYVGDRINKGKGSVVVDVPPGIANYVTVKVTGPESGTVWDYTVNCPR